MVLVPWFKRADFIDLFEIENSCVLNYLIFWSIILPLEKAMKNKTIRNSLWRKA